MFNYQAAKRIVIVRLLLSAKSIKTKATNFKHQSKIDNHVVFVDMHLWMSFVIEDNCS